MAGAQPPMTRCQKLEVKIPDGFVIMSKEYEQFPFVCKVIHIRIIS